MASLSGGGRLTAFLQKVSKQVSGQPEVKVGFLEGSVEQDGTSMPLVAATNEFGVPSRGQPPRPFMRNAVRDDQKSWGDQATKALPRNGFDVDKTMTDIGKLMQGDIKKSITQLISPPLSPRTIAKKKSKKPLVDTGTMLKSVDYEVVKRGS